MHLQGTKHGMNFHAQVSYIRKSSQNNVTISLLYVHFFILNRIKNKKVNTVIYDICLLWENKEIKLTDILIQDYDKGGLRIIDFEMVIKASKLNWIKEYLKPTVNGT